MQGQPSSVCLTDSSYYSASRGLDLVLIKAFQIRRSVSHIHRKLHLLCTARASACSLTVPPPEFSSLFISISSSRTLPATEVRTTTNLRGNIPSSCTILPAFFDTIVIFWDAAFPFVGWIKKLQREID